MDGIIAFLQMLVVVPYSIFLLAVFMYCIWKCVFFVNDLIRGLLGNRLQSNDSEAYVIFHFICSYIFRIIIISHSFLYCRNVDW